MVFRGNGRNQLSTSCQLSSSSSAECTTARECLKSQWTVVWKVKLWRAVWGRRGWWPPAPSAGNSPSHPPALTTKGDPGDLWPRWVHPGTKCWDIYIYIFWINGWILKVNSNRGSNRNSVENYCLFTVFHPTYTIFLNYFKLRSELQWVRSHLTPLPTHSLSTVLAFKWHTLYNNKKNITSFHSKLLVTLKGGPRRTLALCLRRCRPSAWAPLETLNQWNVSEQRWTQAKPVQKRRKTGRAMHC